MSENKRRKRKGERPDGLIQRSLQIGYQQNGKPLRKYFYGHTSAESKRKRDADKAGIESGRQYSDGITVEE